MIALSIRQPWAWLILNGGKDVENRTWETAYRGPCLMHAGLTMTRREYDECAAFLNERDMPVSLPGYWDLPRGGIVGVTSIVGCVKESDSPWFAGPVGLVLAGSKALRFVQCPGRLGFFRVPDSVEFGFKEEWRDYVMGNVKGTTEKEAA